MKISHGYKHEGKEKYEIPVGHVSLVPIEELVKHVERKVMRDPKVPNKYGLTWKTIKKLEVGDESKICESLFWRNNVVNAWCISRSIGTNVDRRFCTDNEIWIGIYDKPYYRRRVHVHVNCWGGMGKYEFCDFYNYKEIENERDLQTQEKLLEVLNMLIDEGILKIPKSKQ